MSNPIPEIIQERARQIREANPNKKYEQKTLEELAADIQALISRAHELAKK